MESSQLNFFRLTFHFCTYSPYSYTHIKKIRLQSAMLQSYTQHESHAYINNFHVYVYEVCVCVCVLRKILNHIKVYINIMLCTYIVYIYACRAFLLQWPYTVHKDGVWNICCQDKRKVGCIIEAHRNDLRCREYFFFTNQTL